MGSSITRVFEAISTFGFSEVHRGTGGEGLPSQALDAPTPLAPQVPDIPAQAPVDAGAVAQAARRRKGAVGIRERRTPGLRSLLSDPSSNLLGD